LRYNTRLQFTTLLSSGTLLSYSRRRVPSVIGTILDSLITFRISFPLMKEVNLPLSRLYIPQQSPLTIISGSGVQSPFRLMPPLRNVLRIWSVQSLCLICHYLISISIWGLWSLLMDFLLSDILYFRTSLTLTPDCHHLFLILVP